MNAIEISKILTKLLDCEYPFQWEPRSKLEAVPDDMIGRLTEQLDEKIFDSDFEFEFYEHGTEQRIEKALEMIQYAEKKVEEHRETSPEMNNMSEALLHIIMSTKIYLLLETENPNTAATVMSKLPQKDAMNIETRAALFGLRAVFFSEYGINGSKLALEFISTAIEMGADESLWYFLKGKFLGRIRRVERPFDVPSAEEVEFLEKATKKKSNSPPYLVFTAQLYCETANRIFRTHKIKNSVYPPSKIVVDRLNKKSVELYNKSIELKPNCSHMLFRCAKGLIKLPPPYRDEKRAKEFLDEALKKAPNSGYGNHVMAQYYGRIEKKPRVALRYLKISEKKKVFGAAIDALRLEYQLNESTNLLQRLSDMLEIYMEKPRKCQILSQLVSYHLFVSNNLEKACEYTSEVIRINPNCDDMTQHRPIAINHRYPMSIYDILVDEIKIRLQDSKCSEEIKKYYYSFLNELSWVQKSISLTKPQYLKDKIISASITSEPTMSKKNSSNPGFKKYIRIPQHIQNIARKPTSFRKTDVDQEMSEILRKCQEDFERQKNCNRSTARSASPSGNWRTRHAPTKIKDTKSKDAGTSGGTERKINGHRDERDITTVQYKERNNASEDSDDVEFRMQIYQKTKETLKEQTIPNGKVSNASHPDDIIISMSKIKIEDKLSEEDSNGRENSKDETNYMTHRRERATTDQASKMRYPAKEIRREEEFKYFPKEKQSDLLEKFSQRNESPKRDRRERESEHFHRGRRRKYYSHDDNRSNSFGRNESRSPDLREHKSKYCHRKRSTKYSDEDDHRSNVSKRKSKHSHRRRSSECSNNDDQRSNFSRRSRNRSRDCGERKSKHYRRRSSECSNNDDQRSNFSRRSRNRSRDCGERKSKHSHRRRSSECSNNDDQRSNFSRRSRNRSRDCGERKSKHSHRRRSSECSNNDDQRSNFSRRSRNRSRGCGERKSKHSHRRRSSKCSDNDDQRSNFSAGIGPVIAENASRNILTDDDDDRSNSSGRKENRSQDRKERKLEHSHQKRSDKYTEDDYRSMKYSHQKRHSSQSDNSYDESGRRMNVSRRSERRSIE